MCQSVREGGLFSPLLLPHVHLQAPFKKDLLIYSVYMSTL